MNFLSTAYENRYTEGSNEMTVDFGRNVFICKFMKALLVDATRTGDSNIDISYVIPGGFTLK
jgi:hypothetical protein